MVRFITALKLVREKLVRDPHEQFIQRWNKILLVSCAFTVSWDALFFYIPVVDGKNSCLHNDYTLEIVASIVRTFTDLFYLGHIFLQFHTGYVSPDSRGFGRGELVKNLEAIATRYLKSYFIVDVLAILPFPQMAILIPRLGGYRSTSKDLLTLVVFTQYVPRLFRVYPLYKEVTRISGVVTSRAWAGAVLNLLLYVFCSHVLGAIWYLFSIDKLSDCWHQLCVGHGCLHLHASVYCNDNHVKDYTFNKTYCSFIDPDQAKILSVFDFGMFYEALQSQVVQSRKFSKKISLCFWWGLRSLSSFGQNFKTSNCVRENLFSAFICLSGLVLFSFLFGNIQKYLDSASAKVDDMRLRRRDTEKWMSYRSLPEHLRKKIRKYEQYKWQETGGVNEEDVISELPRDLRTDIKRRLWNLLFDKVPFFKELGDDILDSMCDWVKPILFLENSTILLQGDPVKEVLFIMRGSLMSKSAYNASVTTVTLDAGFYCGSELLVWMADPKNSDDQKNLNSPELPKSYWTVQSLTAVEAFVLKLDGLRFVMKHLRVPHGQNLQYELRKQSELCNTWAAFRIQAEWRRHRKQKAAVEKPEDVTLVMEGTSSLSFHHGTHASKFADTALEKSTTI